MATNDSFEVVLASAKPTDKWRWTRRLSRLGVVGATVLGTGVAFELGGFNGVLAAWLYGLPFSFPLAWHDAFSPALHGSPRAAWGSIHLVLGAATIASWTSMGLAADYVRHRIGRPRDGTGTSNPRLEHDDLYLKAAQLEVERILGDKVPERPSDGVDQPKRLLVAIARLPTVVAVPMQALRNARAV